MFFIAHSSRRVWLASCTANPTGAWVTQQARNLGLHFSDQHVRFLICDRDSKYSGAFDEVFRSRGIRIVKTPVRAPKANAIAERFVRTVRAEPILRAYLKRWKWEVGQFFGGVDAASSSDALRRIAPDHLIFRIETSGAVDQ